MKKSEALNSMIHFYHTLPEGISDEKKMELIIDFQLLHLKMIPPSLHHVADVAYNCEWETEENIIDDTID